MRIREPFKFGQFLEDEKQAFYETQGTDSTIFKSLQVPNIASLTATSGFAFPRINLQEKKKI